MRTMSRIISPSILSADLGNLARDIQMINRSRAEWIHIDVMDGVFVPNISFGFPVVEAIRRETGKILDTHLMIVEPERYIERFAKAGADIITIHSEAAGNLREAIEMIRATGVMAGVSIKPKTPVETVFSNLDIIDLVLIMSVEPGFGGQSFMPQSLDKVRALKAEIKKRGLKTLIEIDGGINEANSEEAFAAGCDILVMGSALFKQPDPVATIEKILDGKQ